MPADAPYIDPPRCSVCQRVAKVTAHPGRAKFARIYTLVITPIVLIGWLALGTDQSAGSVVLWSLAIIFAAFGIQSRVETAAARSRRIQEGRRNLYRGASGPFVVVTPYPVGDRDLFPISGE